MELTSNEEKFIAFYAESGNGTQSYIDAFGESSRGNAAAQASLLLRKPKIRLALESKIEEMTNEAIAGAEEVLEFYSAVMRGELSEEVLIHGELIERAPLLKDRTRAAEQLSKRYGMDQSSFEKSLQLKRVELMMKQVELAIAKEQGDEEALVKLDAIIDKIDGELNV